jgi:hypothetical protein
MVRALDRRGGHAADDPVGAAGTSGIAVALYRFPMDTANPDTAQLVPALEQALDHLPSAAMPSLIGDLERPGPSRPPGSYGKCHRPPRAHALRQGWRTCRHFTLALGDIVPSIE